MTPDVIDRATWPLQVQAAQRDDHQLGLLVESSEALGQWLVYRLETSVMVCNKQRSG